MYGGPYSRTRYSLRKGEGFRISVRVLAAARMRALIGTAADIYTRSFFQAVLEMRGRNGMALPTEVLGESGLSAQIRILPVLFGEAHGTEILDAEANVSADLKMETAVKENLACVISVVQDIYAKTVGTDELKEFVSVLQNLFGGGSFAEILSALTQSAVLDEESLRLNVTIPPGGELRIDTEHFTALLNGQNVLHLYNGDWPELSRSLLRMLVDSGTGGKLTGKVIFTERWY